MKFIIRLIKKIVSYLAGLGLLVSLALCGGGGKQLYDSIRSPGWSEMNCAEFDPAHSDAVWVRLSDCKLNLLGSAYEKAWSREPDKLFIPVRARDADPNAPAKMVLATRDDKLVAAAQAVYDKDKLQEVADSPLEHGDQVFAVRDVDGEVERSVVLDDPAYEDLAKLDLNLAEDFVIIEDRGHPVSPGLAGVLIGGGVLALLLSLGGLYISGDEEDG